MKTKFLLFLFLLTNIVIHAQIPVNGLLGSYDLDNGNLSDATANMASFTKAGTASTNTTDALLVSNNALQLNGDYLTRSDINFTTNTGFVSLDNTITHSFWIKTGTVDTNQRTIIGDSERTGVTFAGSETGYYIYLKDGKVGATSRVQYHSDFANQALLANAENDFLSTAVIADNNWHHIVVRISQVYINQAASTVLRYGLDIEITVDGQTPEFNRDEFLASLNITNGIDRPGNAIVGNNRVENHITTNQYQDEIDNILMYNRVLTTTEVENIYAAGIPPIYVAADATGTNDGSSWANAFTTLEAALTAATNNDDIWIKAGIYHPHASNRTIPYTIDKQNIKIYGGFTGTETQITDRILGANETILSGDLNDNDTGSITSRQENSILIVDVTALGNNLLLDGLTISKANNILSTSNSAAVLKHKSVAKLTLKNCIVKDNISKDGGAGIGAEFELNSSSVVGELTIENCQFINNSARWASSIYSYIRTNTDVNINISNSLFRDNIAGNNGFGNGIAGSSAWLRNLSGNNTSDLNIAITNCTFVNNTDNGALSSTSNQATLMLSQGSVNTTPTNAIVSNSIFWGNIGSGGGITRSITDYNKSPLTSLVVMNSIDELNFNDSSITSRTNTSDANPLFINAANNDYTLQDGSPAVDSGDNSVVTTSTDLNGNQRILAGTVDMGCYERDLNCGEIFDIKLINTTSNTISWNHAFNNAGPFDIIYVESGQPMGNGTLIQNIATNSYEIPTLAFNISYDIYIRAYCNGVASAYTMNTIIKSVHFVDKDATSGLNDGSSWANAFTSLQDALTSVSSTKVIWVAEGTYTPDASDRNVSFVITNSNNIYGGFNGTETALSQRNYRTNVTVLSGDLLGNDMSAVDFGTTDKDDNSIHIINIASNNVILDGITITNGYASDLSASFGAVGAAIIKSFSMTELTIKNSILKNNISYTTGAIYAGFNGGNGNGSLTIENTIFDNNLATFGSGIYSFSNNNASVTTNITNCLFTNNVSKDRFSTQGLGGSAMWLKAFGIASTYDTNIINCTFANNQDNATATGVDKAVVGLGQSNGVMSSTVSNSIFYHNTGIGATVTTSLDRINDNPGNTLVNHSIGEDNFSNISGSNLTNTSNSNPLFVDAANDDYTLQNGSPAIDTGNNTVVTASTDLLGSQRIFNTTVDIGAYEYAASLSVSLKVFLQGAMLSSSSSLMNDDLRAGNDVPTTAPYTDGATCDASVFTVTGNNAIVDWIWVELRDATTNTTIIESQSALLQRDGDVVGVDGISSLVFNQAAGNYYVVLKHRNHLGVMTNATISLSGTTTVVDFTDANNQITFGTNAQTTFGMPTGVVAMWTGNVNGDSIVQYSGTTPDAPSILSQVLNASGNFLNFPTYILEEYNVHDVNMDGNIQYTGTTPDTPFILQNVLAHPGNFLNFSTYQIQEQLPEN